jgi:threonine synthase
VYLPASAGTLLLGVASGFRHLVESNVIEAMPIIVACQTSQVSPLYHHFKGSTYHPPERIASVADALVSTNPPLLDLMTKALREAEGNTVTVEETEIARAFQELAHKGFFVEPSSAVAYAAYKKQTNSGKMPEEGNTVIVLTGTGLKTSLKPAQIDSLTSQYKRF